MFFSLPTWAVGLLILLAIGGACVVGAVVGRQLRRHTDALREPIGIVQGALLALVGLILAFNMFVAASTVHLRNGFFLPSGFEFTFVLFLASLAIAAAGAGRYSADALLGRRVVTEEIPVPRGRVAA